MSLPKIQSPYYPVTLHASNRKIKIRPFTVKEEKLLLMAAQDKDDSAFIMNTIYQVLDNCIEGDFPARLLPTFDVEYLFIKLRSFSVGNTAKIRFTGDDDKPHDAEINLDDVKLVVPEGHSNKIELNDTYTITLKYPTFDDFLDATTDDKQDTMSLITSSIDKLINVETDEIISMADHSKAEVVEFVDSFTSKNMRDIEQFFATLPSVKIDVEYIMEDGNKNTKEIVGLVSFFSL